MFVRVGTGLLTANVSGFEVPPPAKPLLTKKLRGPVAEAAVIVTFAVRVVRPSTVRELIVIPEPTFSDVTPLMKFVPWNVRFRVCSLSPLAGKTLVRVGAKISTANS